MKKESPKRQVAWFWRAVGLMLIVLSDLLRRLRIANARISERAEADTGRFYRTEYAQCRKFLSEGADLLSEGSELVGRIAREKDALAEIVK